MKTFNKIFFLNYWNDNFIRYIKWLDLIMLKILVAYIVINITDNFHIKAFLLMVLQIE